MLKIIFIIDSLILLPHDKITCGVALRRCIKYSVGVPSAGRRHSSRRFARVVLSTITRCSGRIWCLPTDGTFYFRARFETHCALVHTMLLASDQPLRVAMLRAMPHRTQKRFHEGYGHATCAWHFSDWSWLLTSSFGSLLGSQSLLITMISYEWSHTHYVSLSARAHSKMWIIAGIAQVVFWRAWWNLFSHSPLAPTGALRRVTRTFRSCRWYFIAACTTLLLHNDEVCSNSAHIWFSTLRLCSANTP